MENRAPPPPPSREPVPGLPPPPLPGRVWRRLVRVLFTLSVCGTALSLWVGIPRLLFLAQIGLLTATVCAVPTIASKVAGEQRRFARMALQILLFVSLIVGFALWVLGTSAMGIWIVYAVGLVLVLEVGGHVNQWYVESTLGRLSDSAVANLIATPRSAIEKMFHHESILYVSVPLGLVAGTIAGLLRQQSPQDIIGLCLHIVLLGASAVLLWFLLYACVRMADPLFSRAHVIYPMIANELRRERTGRSGTGLTVIAPDTPTETGNQEQKDFDLASVVTDLRKIYLCDALHNLILLVAFAAVLLSLWGLNIDVKSFVVAAAGGAVIFNQLPFMVGQLRLRGEVLKNYRNSKRIDMAGQLKAYAPLYPTLEFLVALVSSPTAGGVLYVLCSNLIDNTLKL